VKDALERKLHKLVCTGQLDLKTAQSEIASNWIEAYEKYVGKSPRRAIIKAGDVAISRIVQTARSLAEECSRRSLGIYCARIRKKR
jgi:hypothetical protein